MIRYLSPLDLENDDSGGVGGPDHPMRVVTRQVAGLEEGEWTDALRERVRANFDDLAQEWHSRISPARVRTVRDALTRGLGRGRRRGVALEIGSGIGAYSKLLFEHFSIVVAVDLSMEMLNRAPAGPAHRVQGDGSILPFADSSAAGVVLVNAFLFPAEVDRVLARDGVLVWVNTSGPLTPIYLPSEEVARQLPGQWSGVASRAGEGTWCVLSRS